MLPEANVFNYSIIRSNSHFLLFVKVLRNSEQPF